MTSKIEMGKQYKNTYGPVRLLCTDRPCDIKQTIQTVVALTTDGTLFTTDATGRSNYGKSYDLFEVKPKAKHTLWLNIYDTWVGGLHYTKDAANKEAVGKRFACVKIEIDCEEGEGLE